ncbi:MAG: hypothetical protein ACE5E9_14910 [Nitrospinaceae bacterium]
MTVTTIHANTKVIVGGCHADILESVVIQSHAAISHDHPLHQAVFLRLGLQSGTGSGEIRPFMAVDAFAFVYKDFKAPEL